MTKIQRFQQAIAELEKLPEAAQDAIAECLLEYLNEQRWEMLFQVTTDAQWQRIVSKVWQEIVAGKSVPLDLEQL